MTENMTRESWQAAVTFASHILQLVGVPSIKSKKIWETAQRLNFKETLAKKTTVLCLCMYVIVMFIKVKSSSSKCIFYLPRTVLDQSIAKPSVFKKKKKTNELRIQIDN